MHNIEPENYHTLFEGLSSNGFTFMPMERIRVVSRDLQSVVSNIGGRWTFIAMAVFILGEVFLVDKMLYDHATIVKKKLGDDDSNVQDVVTKMKKRLSYVQLYELFEKFEKLEARVGELEQENHVLREKLK